MPDKIIFTGTASGQPSVDRAGSSIVIEINDSLYQVDAGEGFAGSAIRCGIDCNLISTIFISHMHPDHVVGLFMELQWMYLQGRKEKLDIYIPDEAIDCLRKAIDMFYLLEDKFPFRFDITPIGQSAFFSNNDLTVAAFPNGHLVHNTELVKNAGLANRCQAYSFKIEISEMNLFYTGDIKSPDEIENFIDSCDILIVEGKHISVKELIEFARNKSVKKTVITHLDDDDLKYEIEYLSFAESIGYAGLYIARDGLIVEI